MIFNSAFKGLKVKYGKTDLVDTS